MGPPISAAQLATGRVDCWGYGEEGELGDGYSRNSSLPVPVRGITNPKVMVPGGIRLLRHPYHGQSELLGRQHMGPAGERQQAGTIGRAGTSRQPN